MISTIAIEREYGSGAAAIAEALAKRLDWTLWDREITAEIAPRLHCSFNSVQAREEKLDPTFYRLMKAFMRGSYEDRISGPGHIELLDADHLAQTFENIVTDLATKGRCVIVGRGAPWFLRKRRDVLSAFIYAPYDEKLRRLRQLGQSEEEAHEKLERIDAERAAFVKKYYAKEWPLRSIYHLMINSRIGDEAVIDLILHEMRLLNDLSRNDSGTLATAS